MKNKTIIERLKETEIQLEKNVTESLKLTDNKTQLEFYNLWKEHDSNKNIESMFNDLKTNINNYWLNDKYNNDLKKEFNMLYFEHGGLYGGAFDTFAIDFNYSSIESPIFKTMDERLNYLENISCLPGCIIPLLSDLTREIQGKENDFDDWEDLMDIYNLFETAAFIESYQTFLRAHHENIFSKLNFKKPFYLAVGEHDAGAPKLLYVIE
ncbi:hypothetical protein Q1W71_04125 [Flavobacterium pectinovorum]|uniref:hypothetical protein n=1 Tax=Flavobacterium pectinovorum TaxID=29533 RepID=UPI00265E3BAB|nr:hypothetical protein [Flavobacterium pectinovorum]WKL48974.1 hypothetical protein Q1W71_04125 [Flavobacterium pectinovorum]